MRGAWGSRLMFDRAHVGAVVEDLLPSGAAVERAVEAAVGVGGVGVAQGGDVDAVGVGGIHHDAADAVGGGEADAAPGLAGVGGLVHAVAVGIFRADVGLAGADVDDVGVGGGNGDGADGLHRLGVEDRVPGAAGVVGLPHPAAHRAEVEGVGLAGHARHRDGTAAAHGADVAPVQAGQQGRGELRGLRRGGEGEGEQREEQAGNAAQTCHRVTSKQKPQSTTTAMHKKR